MKTQAVRQIKYFTIVTVLLSMAVSVFGQTDIVTAGAGGMGNARIAGIEGAAAVYYNPAAIVGLMKMSSDIGFGYEGFPLVENWSALYVKPFYSATYMGLGFIRRSRTIDNNEYNSFQFIIPTTSKFSNIASGGLNLKSVYQKSGSGEYVSKFSPDFSILLDYSSIKMCFLARDFIYLKMASLHPEYLIGWGYYGKIFSFETDLFSGKWYHIDSEHSGYRLGLEMKYREYYALRCGMEDEGGRKVISLGSGVLSIFKTNGFDYCYRADIDNFNGGSHWVSYSYNSP